MVNTADIDEQPTESSGKLVVELSQGQETGLLMTVDNPPRDTKTCISVIVSQIYEINQLELVMMTEF